MANKILGVVRASTVRQETESQKEDLRRFILSKGYTDDDIEWIVAHVSSTRNLDVYENLLEQIKHKCMAGCSAVAFYHLNRLGRKESFLIKMKEFFIENKIQMYSREPDFCLLNEDGSENQAGSMLYSLFTQVIAGDNRERAEKFKRGKDFKQKAGGYIGGRVLYGYDVDQNSHLVECPEESAIVRRIFNMYLSRKHSCRSISRELNNEGLTHRGNMFTPGFIHDILNNDGYTGESTKGKNRWPVIIDRETFDSVATLLKDNTTVKSRERKRCEFLSRIIKCNECGRSYVDASRVWTCVTKKWPESFVRDIGKCCSINVSTEILENTLWQITMAETMLRQIADEKSVREESEKAAEECRKRLDGLNAELERMALIPGKLTEKFARGLIAEEHLERALLVHRKEKESVAEEIITETKRLAALLTRISGGDRIERLGGKSIDMHSLDFKGEDAALCRDMMREIVKKVSVRREGKMTFCDIETLSGKTYVLRYKLLTNTAGEYECGWLTRPGRGEKPMWCKSRENGFRLIKGWFAD